jgi:hypothetical protein
MECQLICCSGEHRARSAKGDFQAVDLLFRVIPQMINVFEKLIDALSRVIERKKFEERYIQKGQDVNHLKESRLSAAFKHVAVPRRGERTALCSLVPTPPL